MRLSAAFALALVLAAVAAASERSTVGIAFVNEAGLYAVSADGSGLNLLRGYGCPPDTRPPCPIAKATSWSPDGTKLAFTIAHSLYVYNTLDGTHRRLETGADADSESPAAWSPDGKELAFSSVLVSEDVSGEARPSGGFTSATTTSLSDLYAVNLETGVVRKLTDGAQTTDPAWAPGPQVVYSSLQQNRWELYILDGGPRRLTDGGAGVNRRASWSPDGTEIAFLRDAGGQRARLNAIRPDGTGLRQLSNLPIDLVSGDPPAWSPDGTLLAVSTSLNGRLDPTTANRPGRDLYVVAADGTDEMRLTQSAERGTQDRGPTWAPDGSRIAFETRDRDRLSESALYTVNADGRCELRVAAVAGWRPVWQPLRDVIFAPTQCTDLALVATELTTQRTLGRFKVKLVNDGTTPLTGVRLRADSAQATILTAAGRQAACALTAGGVDCEIATIAAGATAEVDLTLEARILKRVGKHNLGPDIRFRAAARGREASLVNNRLRTHTSVWGCATRAPGSGVIRGNSDGNLICGRRGADRITALGGDDIVDGGAGNDVLSGGAGNDTLTGGRGKDRISCGPGRDRVHADALDRVARDCERVTGR